MTPEKYQEKEFHFNGEVVDYSSEAIIRRFLEHLYSERRTFSNPYLLAYNRFALANLIDILRAENGFESIDYIRQFSNKPAWIYYFQK